MKVYIVAPDFAESETLRRRYELSPSETRYVDNERVLRGTHHPQVIASNCFGIRNPADYQRRVGIYQQLDITEARVAIVPCRIKRED